MPAFIVVISTVPPCSAERVCTSPPSVPPGKSLTVIFPSLLSFTIAANFSMPSAIGEPMAPAVANLTVC